MKRPPATITIKFCPVCGRTDRFSAFIGRGHMIKGKRCPGRITVVTYRVEVRQS